MLVLAVISLQAIWSNSKQRKEIMRWWKSQNIRQHALPLLALAPLMFIGCALFYTRYLPVNEHGGINAGGAVWSDMPIHMMFANSFLHGENKGIHLLDLKSPVYSQAPLHYPFIPDFHMAAIAAAGGTMRNASWFTGALQFCSFVVLAYSLAYRVSGSRLASFLVPVLVVGAGGMGGVDIVRTLGWRAALYRDPIQDTAYGNGEVWWFGFLPHVFLPQRGATWAYPLALLVVILGCAAYGVRSNPQSKRRLLLAAAATAILMPLLQVRHPH